MRFDLIFLKLVSYCECAVSFELQMSVWRCRRSICCVTLTTLLLCSFCSSLDVHQLLLLSGRRMQEQDAGRISTDCNCRWRDWHRLAATFDDDSAYETRWHLVPESMSSSEASWPVASRNTWGGALENFV